MHARLKKPFYDENSTRMAIRGLAEIASNSYIIPSDLSKFTEDHIDNDYMVRVDEENVVIIESVGNTSVDYPDPILAGLILEAFINVQRTAFGFILLDDVYKAIDKQQ